jgi:ribosome-associated protein
MEKKSALEIEELANFIASVLEDNKGQDVEVLPIGNRSSLADYFVICSATSAPQVNALVREVEEKVLEKYHMHAQYSEGFDTKRWVVLDYMDVVVHILMEEERQYYAIERLWRRDL